MSLSSIVSAAKMGALFIINVLYIALAKENLPFFADSTESSKADL